MNKEWMEESGLNRQILKASWWIVLVIILISSIGISISMLSNESVLRGKPIFYLFVPSILSLTILGLTHILSKFIKAWASYVILLGIFFVLHVYILIFPQTEGILYMLLANILVSALYFQRKKVYFTVCISVISILMLSFFYDPLMKELVLGDIFAIIGIFVGVTSIAIGVIYRGKYLMRELEESLKQQESLLIKNILMDKANKLDALTDLYNHKTFHEYIDRLIEQSESFSFPLHLAIFDIDNFKQVNDCFGHWVGDIVLRRVGEEIKDHVTPDDFVSRYGGEEFAVILTDKNEHDAYRLIEQIRQGISTIQHTEMNQQAVTVSVGMCTYQQGLGKETFFKSADTCLYQAKRTGKNRTIVAEKTESL